MPNETSRRDICVLLKAFEICVSESGGNPDAITRVMRLIGCDDEIS